MWTVTAGGHADGPALERLRAMLAELLSSPEFGTALSSWRTEQPTDRVDQVLHLGGHREQQAASQAEVASQFGEDPPVSDVYPVPAGAAAAATCGAVESA